MRGAGRFVQDVGALLLRTVDPLRQPVQPGGVDGSYAGPRRMDS